MRDKNTGLVRWLFALTTISALACLTGCVTGQVTPEHAKGFESGKTVRLIYGNPSSHVVASPPSAPSAETLQQFQKAWRFVHRTRDAKEAGKDDSRRRELTELGPGTEVFFAARFLKALNLKLAAKGERADAEITVAAVILRRRGTAARYLAQIYMSAAKVKSMEKIFASDGDNIEEAFEQAGFYTGFGKIFEDLCGRERACRAWNSLLLDPEIHHELIYLAAVESLGRLRTEPALTALRTAEQQHANPLVRQKAKAALSQAP